MAQYLEDNHGNLQEIPYNWVEISCIFHSVLSTQSSDFILLSFYSKLSSMQAARDLQQLGSCRVQGLGFPTKFFSTSSLHFILSFQASIESHLLHMLRRSSRQPAGDLQQLGSHRV
jgi:hypothetical protein